MGMCGVGMCGRADRTAQSGQSGPLMVECRGRSKFLLTDVTKIVKVFCHLAQGHALREVPLGMPPLFGPALSHSSSTLRAPPRSLPTRLAACASRSPPASCVCFSDPRCVVSQLTATPSWCTPTSEPPRSPCSSTVAHRLTTGLSQSTRHTVHSGVTRALPTRSVPHGSLKAL